MTISPVTISTENKTVFGTRWQLVLLHWSSANAWKTRFYFADGLEVFKCSIKTKNSFFYQKKHGWSGWINSNRSSVREQFNWCSSAVCYTGLGKCYTSFKMYSSFCYAKYYISYQILQNDDFLLCKILKVNCSLSSASTSLHTPSTTAIYYT